MDSENHNRITIAIAAMGGQGGGVLADWLIEMGEEAGYYVQSTSVPGVAQRTGTTIYYLELFPEGVSDRQPVMALMPVSGDVDIVIAAELAEAGRAVQRGIVTPDRTTLIASDHRYYSIAEKSAMGDGRGSSAEIRSGIAKAAKNLICFDMLALAEAHNTVVSATLFGALAGCRALPFSRQQFEAAITHSGKSVANNLAAFAAAFTLADEPEVAPLPGERSDSPVPSAATHPRVTALLERIDRDVCRAARKTALLGVQRLIDYQDPAYASEYLDRLGNIQAVDVEADNDARLTETVARHLALWMSYEDSFRVADLKIRRERFERAREEVLAGENELVYLTEYLHPRFEEVADALPHSLGKWLMTTSWAQEFLTKFILRERKIHTSKLSGFLLLYGVAFLRCLRRISYRYAMEKQRTEQWLRRIESLAASNYELAIEVALCQNLIKGYGDTHARGFKNFETIMSAMERNGADNGSATLVGELRRAALADENGDQLRERLAQIA